VLKVNPSVVDLKFPTKAHQTHQQIA